MTAPSSPPLLDRARFLAELRSDSRFDALIVGGGIAGAATFRDLCAQGLRCLLVERNDFASGASGALTRVAQGGFRYLENGEVSLVQRSVTERNRFVAAAPHQTRPIRVVLPTETLAGGAGIALGRALGLSKGHSLPGALVLRAAVALYEFLGRKTRILPRGGFLGRKALRRRYPGISSRYAGAAYEFEALIATPERVAIELLEDGVAEGGRSIALNYARLEAAGNRIGVVDAFGGQSFDIEARVVVNAAGANADRVARLFGVETRTVDGVAGTHLILRCPAIAKALGDDLLFFEDASRDAAKRRLCCAYAIGETILLGATETPVDEADRSRPLPSEDDYLIAALGRLFPGASVAREDIIERLHGVRPLVAAGGDDVTGRSRDHVIHTHPAAPGRPALVTIAGGKWTTFRAIAEDAADAALAILGRPRASSTARAPIGGGREKSAQGETRRRRAQRLVDARAIDRGLAERLVATYGSRADRVAAYLVDVDARRPLAGGAIAAGEVSFFAREEMATSADDVVRRRTRLFLEGRASRETLDDIEHILAAGAPSASPPTTEALRHASV